jgi:hypothetical protein
MHRPLMTALTLMSFSLACTAEKREDPPWRPLETIGGVPYEANPVRPAGKYVRFDTRFVYKDSTVGFNQVEVDCVGRAYRFSRNSRLAADYPFGADWMYSPDDPKVKYACKP